ncbi:MAG: hemolysin III family protein [Saprospiraceae bacterium]
MTNASNYSNFKEELANAITHGLGLLLSIIGIPVLISFGVDQAAFSQIIGLAIFCFSLLMVYTSSTLYHSFQHVALKKAFRLIDHISIYFLIAGTHTPFILMYLNNTKGTIFLILLWTLVGIGVLYKLFFMNRFKWFSLIFYLGLAYMAVFTLPSMMEVMSMTCLFWIIGGGVSYTLGTFFYVFEKIPYHHAIWHLFVIGGSLCHFIALLEAVQP